MFHIDKFLAALPIMGQGMLGIFLVTAVIVITVYVLNAIPGVIGAVESATVKLLTKNKK